jgi:prepilin-type processing-associated H-X9-DG protein
MQRTAITLIEILIVAAIISVLAGLLLPTISMVRASAGTAVCLSNQRQIGLAVMAYSADERDCIPPWNAPAPDRDLLGLKYFGNWYGFIEGYIPEFKTSRIWFCPQGPWKASELKSPMDDVWFSPNAWYCNSYGYSTVWDGQTRFGNGRFKKWWKWNLNSFERPSETVLLAEIWSVVSDGKGGVKSGEWADFIPPCFVPAKVGTGKIPVEYPDIMRASHRGRSNMVFLDGHVASAVPDTLCKNGWSAPNAYTGEF